MSEEKDIREAEPFNVFQDDQDDSMEIKDKNEIEQEEGQQHSQQFDIKDINVKGGVNDEDGENVIQYVIKQKPKLTKRETIKQEKQEISLMKKIFLGAFLVISICLTNIFLLYPILSLVGFIMSVIGVVNRLLCKKEDPKEKIFNPLIMCVFSLSVIMVIYFTKVSIFQEKIDIYSIWFIDAFILYLTHIMIFTITKLIKQNKIEISCGAVCAISDPNNMTALVYNIIRGDQNPCSVDLPISSSEEWNEEYLRIINDVLEVDINQQRFNTLLSHVKNPDIYQYVGYSFFLKQNQPLKSSRAQYVTLQLITLIKILVCILYLETKSSLSWENIIQIMIITLFNINEMFCFNNILSNNDLRRKASLLNQINSAIQVSGENINHFRCIDVTSNLSIETWDNARRSVLEFFSAKQKKLELSYMCLFVYYLFIFNIILAAFGEINFIISKESILMHPLVVMSSTFTFLILNVIIFFRLYYGQKFNDTLADVQGNIDQLNGIFQDLLQQYDFYFTKRDNGSQLYKELINYNKRVGELKFIEGVQKVQENQDDEERKADLELCQYYKPFEMQDNIVSTYDVIVSKIKLNAEMIISKGQEFKGRVYKQSEEKELHQKMVKNCLLSFNRIKEQVDIDTQENCYKALNIAKLDFRDSLVTIVFGLLTVLPPVITSFIGYFKETSHQLN